jgi:hypothetical protein
MSPFQHVGFSFNSVILVLLRIGQGAGGFGDILLKFEAAKK